MKITTRTLVIAAVFLAITLLLGQIPFLGFVPMPWGISATTLQIPTILAGIIGGPIAGLLTGLGFGVTSFIRAGQPGGNIIFTDPLISILPRLFIGPGAWAVYAALSNNMGGQCCSVRWFVPFLAPGFWLLGVTVRDFPRYRTDFAVLAGWGAVLSGLMLWVGPWAPPAGARSRSASSTSRTSGRRCGCV